MQFSVDQEQALDAIGNWLSNCKAETAAQNNMTQPFFSLHGAAGCGKTTLAQYVAHQHNGPTVAMTYAGKAAAVLRKKGLPNARTVHSTIYLPNSERNEEIEKLETERKEIEAIAAANRTDKDNQQLRRIRRRLEILHRPNFTLRESASRGGPVFERDTLIILDEMSMCDEQLAHDLMSYNKPILCLGDPFQLPPIKGTGYFDNHVDFTLTQIHRQAEESPIIHLATLARGGKPLVAGKYGDSIVTYRTKIGKAEALQSDQIVCGSNKARVELNSEIRGFRDLHGDFPVKGDKLICLRNNPGSQLLNGQMFDVLENTDIAEGDTAVNIDMIDNSAEDAYARSYRVHKECFEEPEAIKSWSYNRRSMANEFDYGWAITAHKAQGSQWDNVLVWADSFRWDRALFQRWLYTAITRAAENVIVAL